MTGLVLVDKPSGSTSHDVVNRWRKLAQTRRVGHLGTLDPMATGLLALVTGNATRLAQFFGRDTKTYLAEIVFGVVSDTYDADGTISATGVNPPLALAEIARELDRFRGKFLQTPPAVSAKKIHGVPAYKLARKQAPVELTPVEVEISRLRVENWGNNCLRLEVTCSAGTYLRSLANDLGALLGCGAILSSLRRIRAGDLRVEDAFTLDRLTELALKGALHSAVRPASSLLPQFPPVYVEPLVESQIRQGREFRTSPFVVPPGTPHVKALSRAGDLIAIGNLVIPNVYHPGTVL